jgi:hypothetical protein
MSKYNLRPRHRTRTLRIDYPDSVRIVK